MKAQYREGRRVASSDAWHGTRALLAAGLCGSLLACAARQQPPADPSAPDKNAIVVRLESVGSLLDGLRARVPTMSVSYPTGDCPRVMFRGQRSARNQGNPSVYVDGTLIHNTCILAQIQASDVDRVEVFPSGNTSRPGIQRNPFGLILVFRVLR